MFCRTRGIRWGARLEKLRTFGGQVQVCRLLAPRLLLRVLVRLRMLRYSLFYFHVTSKVPMSWIGMKWFFEALWFLRNGFTMPIVVAPDGTGVFFVEAWKPKVAVTSPSRRFCACA